MTRQGEWRWLQLWWKGAASVNRPQDASKNTITKLLGELGNARSRYQVQTLPNLPCKRLPCDEIWAFVYAKKKNVTPEILERNPDTLDAWTWTAIDADSKLCVSWIVGTRDADTATQFMRDIESRLASRIQLTTDQWSIPPRLQSEWTTRCCKSSTRWTRRALQPGEVNRREEGRSDG